MKKAKVILSAILAGAVIMSMAPAVMAAEDVTPAGDYKIGFSQATMASPFYVTMVDEFESYCKDKGVEPMAISADEDVQKQNQDIMDMIAAGIDALILNPINLESVQTGIDACVEAGIPVITVDRMASSGGTAVVKRDNYEMGRLTGEALLEALGGADKAEGTILELQGTAGDQVMMDRRDGFESVFEGVDGITIVQSVNCDYVRAKALTAAQDMIQGNDNIVAIYGHNDDMAMGGLQAAQEAGLEDVMVCGVDGLMEAVEAIANGEGYVATTLNDPGTELKVAADTAIKVLNGEDYEEEVDAGTGLIDTSNAADYVDDTLSFAAMK